MTDVKRNGLTYAASGRRYRRRQRHGGRDQAPGARHRRPGADAEIGGFGGLFDLKAAGFKDPILVAANDGVGTKVKIAIETGIHDTIGIDLVAMCVNDIIVQGAEPLFFLDYFATGKLDPGSRRRDRAGHRRRLPPGRLRADRRRDGRNAGPLRGRRLRPRGLRGRRRRARHAAAEGTSGRGDVLIGLPSSGVHSNGFSLVRRIVERSGLAWDAPPRSRPARASARRCSTPTRIYVKPLLARPEGNATASRRSPTSPAAAFPTTSRASCRTASACALDLDAIPVAAGVRLACRERAASPRPRCCAPSIAASA